MRNLLRRIDDLGLRRLAVGDYEDYRREAQRMIDQLELLEPVSKTKDEVKEEVGKLKDAMRRIKKRR